MRPPVALLLAALIGLFGVLSEAPAGAQEALTTSIREVALDDDGATRLIVSTAGDAVEDVLGSDSFTVTENGEAVSDVEVEPLLESQVEQVLVVLLLDVSGSTQGEPLANAKEAAKVFVSDTAAEGVQIGIVAFGEEAELVAEFTTDPAPLGEAIDGLEARGETALYDAIALSASELASRDGLHNIVLFSDGGDTVSEKSLDEVVAIAQDLGASVTTVALSSPEFDEAALQQLADATGGRAVSVGNAADLSGAFEQVARQIASQYVLTYRSEVFDAEELDIAVRVRTAGVEASDSAVVLNTRQAGPQPVAERPAAEIPEAPLGGLLNDNGLGLWAGTAAAFLGLALILGVAASSATPQKAGRLLRRYSEGRGDKRASLQGGQGRELAQRAADLAHRLPKPEGFEVRLQQEIDRAGWHLRASEFLVLQAVVALGAAVVSFLVTFHVVGVFLGLVFGFLAPRLVLAQRVSARQTDFLEQLPDTLQLLAGSLRAGYGLLQALDTAVQESPEPTATEFSRVLTEARLGMPLEDALEGMAERVDSEDFRWVVVAINIQRQVGGNLAQLLDTVASTLREREMVRRQIKTLSAEGRLSAVVLTALPFAVGLYMFFVNTSYIMLLFTRTIGWMMVGVAMVLIVLGIVWMRKLIQIDV